jgi:hypothetical protein
MSGILALPRRCAHCNEAISSTKRHGQQRKSSQRCKGREFELKLEMSKEMLDRLKDLEKIPGWCSQVRSVYFDTSDHRLHNEAEKIKQSQRSDGQYGAVWYRVMRSNFCCNQCPSPTDRSEARTPRTWGLLSEMPYNIFMILHAPKTIPATATRK